MYLLSANAFNLVKPKILSLGNELNLADFTIIICWSHAVAKGDLTVPNNNFLDGTRFKAFADDIFKSAKIMISVFDRVENIAGKRENAGDQHFLLFPQCYQRVSLPKFGLCGKGLIHLLSQSFHASVSINRAYCF